MSRKFKSTQPVDSGGNYAEPYQTPTTEAEMRQRGGKSRQRASYEGSKPIKNTDAIIPQGLPSKFFNKEGEVDLRQVNYKEVLAYFSALGINLPVFPRRDGR